MAVKASATITLTSVIDIQAVYRYYLLQSSTLAKPAKPTTNPPASIWDDAEPTYTAGSTNTLYFVDLTVFSNGTFSYSEVSKSTSYEAAKEAYNKAQNAQNTANNAQDDIDNLEVGGRNLLLNTASLSSDNWVFDSSGAETAGTVVIQDNECILITNTQSNIRLYPNTNIQPMISVLPGEELTISAMYKPISGEQHYQFQLTYTTNSGGNIHDAEIGAVKEYSDGWELRYYTFTVPANAVELRVWFRSGLDYELYTHSYQVKHFKLERGNRVTNWSKAPEDVDEEINDAQNTADSAMTSVNNAQLDIDAIKATISSLVTGQNGESLMTQTDTGWTFSIKEVLNTLDKATTDINSLNSDMTSAENLIANLNKDIADLGEYTDYIKFGVDGGKPCIILGETDSVFKVLITNTDIRFMEGSAIPASISNQSLNIEKAVIKSELKQGGFLWATRSNGNLGLLWKG